MLVPHLNGIIVALASVWNALLITLLYFYFGNPTHLLSPCLMVTFLQTSLPPKQNPLGQRFIGLAKPRIFAHWPFAGKVGNLCPKPVLSTRGGQEPQVTVAHMKCAQCNSKIEF